MTTPAIGLHRQPEARVRIFLVSTAALVALSVRRAAAPHKASLARLWDVPLSVLGLGCIDFAAFHVAHGWGWLVTGLSLFLLEYMIADGDS